MAIARTEGVGALYAGVWLTWVKQAPQYAVTFLCYDLAKAWLAAENGNAERERRAAEAAQISDSRHEFHSTSARYAQTRAEILSPQLHSGRMKYRHRRGPSLWFP